MTTTAMDATQALTACTTTSAGTCIHVKLVSVVTRVPVLRDGLGGGPGRYS